MNGRIPQLLLDPPRRKGGSLYVEATKAQGLLNEIESATSPNPKITQNPVGFVPEVLVPYGTLRRLAYGRLHAMLAGSFVRSGEYRRFAGHSVASVAARPGHVRYFAGYPVRALRRCLSGFRVG